SCVSGLRITFTSSYTRFSALSQDLISSFVTQTGRLPRKTVKLIRFLFLTPLVGCTGTCREGAIHGKLLYDSTAGLRWPSKIFAKHLGTKENCRFHSTPHATVPYSPNFTARASFTAGFSSNWLKTVSGI